MSDDELETAAWRLRTGQVRVTIPYRAGGIHGPQKEWVDPVEDIGDTESCEALVSVQEVLDRIDQRIENKQHSMESCSCGGIVDGTLRLEDMCETCYGIYKQQSELIDVKKGLERVEDRG